MYFALEIIDDGTSSSSIKWIIIGVVCGFVVVFAGVFIKLFFRQRKNSRQNAFKGNLEVSRPFYLDWFSLGSKARFSYRRKNHKNRGGASSPTVRDPYNRREHENIAFQTVADTYRKNRKNQNHS